MPANLGVRGGPLPRRAVPAVAIPGGWTLPGVASFPTSYPVLPAAGFGLTRDSAAGSVPTDLAFALGSVSGSGVTAVPRWSARAAPASNFG